MHDPVITVDELADRLDLGAHELVSIVGGGGKTTTLFALGAALGPRVVLTTTTKMGSERTEGHPVVLDPTDDELRAALDEHGRVLVWQHRGDHRADGVTAAECDRWFGRYVADHLVVEADGSRRRPFKAPYPYEPVVPAATTLLLACIGVDALDAPIAEGCHRPDAVVAIVGGDENEPLTPERAARVLLSDEGSRRGLPAEARFAVLMHRVERHHRPLVERLAAELGDAARLLAVAPTTSDR